MKSREKAKHNPLAPVGAYEYVHNKDLEETPSHSSDKSLWEGREMMRQKFTFTRI